METKQTVEGYVETWPCLYKRATEDTNKAYQRDFFGVFGIEEWDSNHISSVMTRIVRRFGEQSWFRSMLSRSPFYSEDDLEYSLSGMFNYDQLDIMHTVLRRAIEGEPMEGEGVAVLMERLAL